MNRSLTAAVALATALGMAGLAQAQVNTNPSIPSNPAMTPSAPGAQATSPDMNSTSPSAVQNPSAATNPGAGSTYGTQGPQANAQMSPGSQQNVSQSQIQQAQQQLKSQGLYSGAIDGVVGPETQTALSQFQKEQGLPQTAQLDQQTLGRLMGGSNGSGAGTPGNSATPNR